MLGQPWFPIHFVSVGVLGGSNRNGTALKGTVRDLASGPDNVFIADDFS